MKMLLMGNEAIARGAIEAGVGVVSAYPGTPSSEIPAAIARLAHEFSTYVEYSTNEKVALEVAIGASWSGIRSMATMKHVGLNVAADPLMTLTYIGTEAGLVVVSADDPSCHSSQNEQDNRYYSLLANIPTLEPSSPQEALDMAKKAFVLSENVKLPIMLRPTTRICHCRGDVKIGNVKKRKAKTAFKRDITHKVTIPAHARKLHPELLSKIERTRQLFEESDFNRIEGKGGCGIIAAGISYAYVKESVIALGTDCSILKLGTIYPLPNKLILDFIKDKKRVIIVEEMEPIIERMVKELAFDNKISVEILGKSHIPSMGELSTTIVKKGISQSFGINYDKSLQKSEDSSLLPPRSPTLCPGCPHRATFYCINKSSKKAIKPSDIGCYTLGVMPPLSAVDTCICMGGSVGVACGLSLAENNKIVATIGDSTFFHTGVPALVNAVYNGHDFTLVIMDNRTTAMTGHQPHPGTGITALGKKAPMIDIKSLCEAIGAHTQEVDPFDLKGTIEALKRANGHKGVSVVVTKRPCVLITEEFKRKRKVAEVDKDQCNGCKACINNLGCPAILFDEDKKKAVIDKLLCIGCGVCVQVCPFEAILNK
ncbi:MAG: indolepyruvate ferredoxin oxidoreductase subunit alpha [Candidatus Methanofastidiosia archaeon]